MTNPTLDSLATPSVVESRLWWDNIGFRICLDDLASCERYVIARDRYKGHGWLSRLWCRVLRPRLLQGSQRAIEEEFCEARFLYQQEIMNAVLGEGSRA